VLAKQVCPGTVHSSSDEEGHHWRSEHVSACMSAKEEPQKKKYFKDDESDSAAELLGKVGSSAKSTSGTKGIRYGAMVIFTAWVC
jgi:hypothetical protein